MICDVCRENEAVMFFEQVSPARRKLHLCAFCAKKYNISPDAQMIGRAIATIFQTLAKNEESEDEKKLCPVCGTNLKSIKTTFKAGCAECYSIFSGELESVFKNLGIKEKYTGSMPKRLRGFYSDLTRRIEIQKKLEESIKREDYEKAAVYNATLRALEKSYVAEGNALPEKKSVSEESDGE